ncbi:MAG: hypothetical protein AAF466_00950 [Bacteroidota bacterium]
MSNNIQNYSPQGVLKTVKMLHLAMVVAPLFFGIFILYSMNDYSFEITDFEDPLVYAIPIVAVLGFVASNYLYKMYITQLQKKETLKEKLTGYLSAVIMGYAPLEGAALLAMVGAYLTQSLLFFTIGALLVAYMIFRRPKKVAIEQDLKLTMEQRDQLNRNQR